MKSIMEHGKFKKISSGVYVKWAAWRLEYDQYNYPEDLDMVSKLIIMLLGAW